MTIIIFIVIAALLSAVTSKGPLDPEEMLFIYTRCMEDHLPEGASRRSTFSVWKNWKLEPENDKHTQCYVKCVLDKVGLYNASTGKFSNDAIKEQSKKYPNLLDGNNGNAFADAVSKLPSVKNDCATVSEAFLKVLESHKSACCSLFHGNPDFSWRIYQKEKGNIRQIGQSYLEFCENKFYPKGSPDRNKLCEIRQYKILKDKKFRQLVECGFKGFRYITKDKQLDLDEVKRDFKLVGKDPKKTDQALNDCKAEAKNKALKFLKCVLNSPIATDFKEAFDYREIRSQNYTYNLAEKQAYSKESIKSQVAKIDSNICPS